VLGLGPACDYSHVHSSPTNPFGEETHRGWPSPDAAPGPNGAPAEDLAPAGDGGIADQAAVQAGAGGGPQCTTFTTRQGAICVSCTSPPGSKPVVSCTGSTPKGTCHEVELDGYSCNVCHDATGKITSKKCSAVKSCTVVAEGSELCLVCTSAGKQSFKACHPASQTCKAVTTTTEICVECTDAGGKVLSKQCKPLGLTCKAEQVQGVECLVCRDTAGNVTSKTCP
jgi:hypothetical protein